MSVCVVFIYCLVCPLLSCGLGQCAEHSVLSTLPLVAGIFGGKCTKIVFVCCSVIYLYVAVPTFFFFFLFL